MTTEPDVTIAVLLFGQARELAGTGETTVAVPDGSTVAACVAALEERYPALAPLDRVLLTAVNETYATRSEIVRAGDTLAVFPPVSGGSGDDDAPGGDVFELTRGDIDIFTLRDRLLRGEDGAVCIFDGVARNNSRGRRTLWLEYEGYEDMALTTMRQIATEAHEQWPAIDRIGIIHRLGRIDD